jgi:cytochrome c oxidase subunit III
MSIQTENRQNPTQLSMNPKVFGMWVFMGSVVMLFAALTSAYIVRQAEGNWYIFDIPPVFYTSSVVILISSITMHMAYLAVKRDNFGLVKTLITITAVLGLVFLALQFYGWVYLVDIQVHFVGNPSGSFLYVLTGMHGLHLISGVIFLFILLVKVFQYKVHSKNMATFQMCATYWHFLDGLWIYLFIFLLLNR